jgi:hypothetical protein
MPENGALAMQSFDTSGDERVLEAGHAPNLLSL